MWNVTSVEQSAEEIRQAAGPHDKVESQSEFSVDYIQTMRTNEAELSVVYIAHFQRIRYHCYPHLPNAVAWNTLATQKVVSLCVQGWHEGECSICTLRRDLSDHLVDKI